MGRSNTKGSTFERWFCRRLTTWWTKDDESDVLWWRTSQSGGRATARLKKGKETIRAHCGDISAVHEQGRSLTDLITFELKRGYAKATIHDLLDAGAGAAEQTYAAWIAQAAASAAAANTPYWMVVHQRPRREPLILTPVAVVRAVAPRAEAAQHARVQIAVGGYDVFVSQLEAFLAEARPALVQQHARIHSGRAAPRLLRQPVKES